MDPLVLFLGLCTAVMAAVTYRAMRRCSTLEMEHATARSLSESANDAMLLADVVEGRILDANPAASSLLGYTRADLLQKSLPELHLPKHRGRSAVVIADVWEKRGLVYSDMPFVGASGDPIDVEISAKVIEHGAKPAVLILARDIRERLEAENKIRAYAQEVEAANRELKEMQAQLVRSEQLASLGNLAAGIAHEINNPIGSINSNVDTARRATQMLREGLSAPAGADPKRLQRALKTLDNLAGSTETAGKRIAGIVNSLRNFARLDEADKKQVDLHEGIDSTLVLIQHQLGSRIAVDKQYGQLPQIVCSPGQLNQVFMHVLMNAADAIEGEGTITITTQQEGPWAVVRFRDTGKGIPQADLDSIFDPGFTTKGAGVGAGLGLSIAFRILEDHQGNVSATSTPGEGTEVTLKLPL